MTPGTQITQQTRSSDDSQRTHASQITRSRLQSAPLRRPSSQKPATTDILIIVSHPHLATGMIGLDFFFMSTNPPAGAPIGPLIFSPRKSDNSTLSTTLTWSRHRCTPLLTHFGGGDGGRIWPPRRGKIHPATDANSRMVLLQILL